MFEVEESSSSIGVEDRKASIGSSGEQPPRAHLIKGANLYSGFV